MKPVWSNKIVIYGSPFIILGGTLGNFLTVSVMLTESFRTAPSSLVLSALAIADTGMLYTGLLRWWISYRYNIDVRGLSQASCKIHFFFTYMFRQLGPLFIAMLTVERAISVYFPLKCKQICSKRNILISLTSCLIFCTLLNAHGFFTMAVEIYYTELEEGVEVYRGCSNPPHFASFFSVMYWIEGTVYAFAPLTIIIIGNVLIVRKLVSAQARRSKMNAESKSDVKAITVMLILVSAFFLILTLPNSIWFIGLGLNAWPDKSEDDVNKMKNAFNIVNLLAYANSAINFILYCISGTKFREALKMSLSKCLPSSILEVGTREPQTISKKTSVTSLSKDGPQMPQSLNTQL